MKVLVTDGDTRHALAIVRSLGKRGMSVTMASARKITSLTFYSKYCSYRLVYPSPNKPEEFINFLLESVKKEHYDVLLPVRGFTFPLISQRQSEFKPYVNLAVVNYESMKLASNKKLTFEFAEKMRIPIPKTFFPTESSQIEDIAAKVEYPLVIKPPIGSGSRGIRYINSKIELISKYRVSKKGINFSEENLPIIQEYIPGQGYGFFALFNNGEPRAIFMHKRIREYPITGGPSAVAESIYNSDLRELGLKILRALNWHGVAMVEFKLDSRDNKFKLMEINPKFWGSLNLSIASGVDFPYLTCKLATEGDITPVFSYKTGLKFRWIFPEDFMHLIANPMSFTQFFKDFFDKNVHHEFSLDDPLPNLFEIGMILGYPSVFKGRLRYPQGKPHTESLRK